MRLCGFPGILKTPEGSHPVGVFLMDHEGRIMGLKSDTRVYPIYESSDQKGINAAFERIGTFQVKFKFTPEFDEVMLNDN